MKKTYQKPMVAVEFYKLSQSIASCSIKINLLNNQCVVNDPDTPVEMRSLAYAYPEYFSSDCYTHYHNIQSDDPMCYHTQANATFTS
jgi:hypothetical protein